MSDGGTLPRLCRAAWAAGSERCVRSCADFRDLRLRSVYSPASVPATSAGQGSSRSCAMKASTAGAAMLIVGFAPRVPATRRHFDDAFGIRLPKRLVAMQVGVQNCDAVQQVSCIYDWLLVGTVSSHTSNTSCQVVCYAAGLP